MQRLILGALDSRVELEILARQIGSRPGSRDRFAYFILGLDRLRLNGFQREQARWIATDLPDLKVFTGRSDEPRLGGARIWSAVSLDGDNLGVLIKSSDGYQGDAQDYADRLAEARDRFERGARQPW